MQCRDGVQLAEAERRSLEETAANFLICKSYMYAASSQSIAPDLARIESPVPVAHDTRL